MSVEVLRIVKFFGQEAERCLCLFREEQETEDRTTIKIVALKRDFSRPRRVV